MRKLLCLTLMSLALWSQLATAQNSDQVQEVEWIDLLSKADLDAILNPPEMTHDGYGWQEQLKESSEGEAYLKALESVDVNPDVLNKRIMIPGFVVPTVFDEDRKVREFFLVPFFGACIHLPPPPPNQIIYVSYERGLELQNLYDAYTVHGTLTSDVVRNDMATSAYRLEAEGVSLYSY